MGCPFYSRSCKCNTGKCKAANPSKKVVDAKFCRIEFVECDVYRRKMIEVEKLL